MARTIKLRIPEDIYAKFKAMHPAYGEESRVMKEMLEAYVRRNGKEEQPGMYERGVESRKV